MDLFATSYADEGVQTAANTAPVGGPDITFIVMMAVAFACFYLFVLRPGNKKNKERAESLKKLEVGDEVLTSGGLIGRITKVNEDLDLLIIEIAPGTSVKINRQYVVSPLPKGTYDERKVESNRQKK